MSSRKDDIINDLIRKKPQGPEGVDVFYSQSEDFCWERNRYVTTYDPSVPNYGYTDDELFSLCLHTRRQVEDYLRERDFEGKSDWNLQRKKATLSRRTNNVWSKIEGAIARVHQEGRPGIYNITGRYHRDDFGHIYAESLHEAQQNAKLFFGYLNPGDNLRAKFVKMGSIDDLSALNLQTKNSIERAIKSTQSQIEEHQSMIESLNSRLSTMSIVEQQQIAVEMVHAIESGLEGCTDKEEVIDVDGQS
mgnify:CR=1 FL=1